MIYKLTSTTNHAITLLYFNDEGFIIETKLKPSESILVEQDDILRYLNLKGLLDPSKAIVDISKVENKETIYRAIVGEAMVDITRIG